MAYRHGVVLERLVVNSDAEGRTDGILTAVTLADRVLLVVGHVIVVLEHVDDLLRHVGQSVLLDQRHHGHLRGGKLRRYAQYDALLAAIELLLGEGCRHDLKSDKEGNEINLFDVLEYEEEDIADRLTRKEHIGKLEQYMEQTLTPREKEILCLRYGIQAKEQKTQREIAEIYQISRSYVSRIEKKALKKLRDRYEDE